MHSRWPQSENKIIFSSSVQFFDDPDKLQALRQSLLFSALGGEGCHDIKWLTTPTVSILSPTKVALMSKFVTEAEKFRCQLDWSVLLTEQTRRILQSTTENGQHVEDKWESNKWAVAEKKVTWNTNNKNEVIRFFFKVKRKKKSENLGKIF